MMADMHFASRTHSYTEPEWSTWKRRLNSLHTRAIPARSSMAQRSPEPAVPTKEVLIDGERKPNALLNKNLTKHAVMLSSKG